MLLQSMSQSSMQSYTVFRRSVASLDRISPISLLDNIFMELNQSKEAMPPIVLPPEILNPSRANGVRTAAASGSRSRGKCSENRALASAVPAAPVVVYAAQVASERQRRVLPKPAMTGKGKASFLAKPRSDATPGVDALRKRWLVQS